MDIKIGKKGRFKACRQRKARKIPSIVLVLIVSVILGLIVWDYWMSLLPSINEIAAMKAKTMVTITINDEIRKQFNENNINPSDLLIINEDGEGTLSFIQSNTVAMNTLKAEIEKGIKERYSEMEPMASQIPLGSIIGSPLLSGVDLWVDLDFLPLTTTKLELTSEFETQGINQTKFKVILNMDSQIKVLIPFSHTTVEVSNSIIVAEAVIVGNVPGSYVNVPIDEAIDGMGV